jgi:hypothetical protein|tara:strand:- start:3932 stop:4129 length:198 start_codon:yes stop_codon:yes gene_type:complete
MIDPTLWSDSLTKSLFALPVGVAVWAWQKLQVVDTLNTRVAVLEVQIQGLENKIDLILENVVKKK